MQCDFSIYVISLKLRVQSCPMVGMFIIQHVKINFQQTGMMLAGKLPRCYAVDVLGLIRKHSSIRAKEHKKPIYKWVALDWPWLNASVHQSWVCGFFLAELAPWLLEVGSACKESHLSLHLKYDTFRTLSFCVSNSFWFTSTLVHKQISGKSDLCQQWRFLWPS